jgi:hypothetical protein
MTHENGWVLRAAGVAVEVRAGGAGTLGAVRVLAAHDAELAPGGLLPVVGGDAASRLAVLEVLAGRRPPAAGVVAHALPPSSVVRHLTAAATGVVVARGWAHLPGAGRVGRARRVGARAATPALHLVLAEGDGGVDQRLVARLLAGVRAGDAIVLALATGVGGGALARRAWQLAGAPRVAHLSCAS